MELGVELGMDLGATILVRNEVGLIDGGLEMIEKPLGNPDSEVGLDDGKSDGTLETLGMELGMEFGMELGATILVGCEVGLIDGRLETIEKALGTPDSEGVSLVLGAADVSVDGVLEGPTEVVGIDDGGSERT